MELTLTNSDKVATIDQEYDYLHQYKWWLSRCGYVVRTSKLGGERTLHRIILSPIPKGKVIDHISGDKLDNRRENLRLCTISQNGANRKVNKTSKSGVKGVSWIEKRERWYASIRIQGKNKSLGYFSDIVDAEKAYLDGARKYYGEFARASRHQDLLKEMETING